MTNIFNPNENFKIYNGNCIDIMEDMDECSVDMIFADPPYFLSGGGTTCFSGKRVSVDKGEWDKKTDIKSIHEYNIKWIGLCKRILKEDGTMWVSGTQHNIYSVGVALQQYGFKILNDVVFEKLNPPPNLARRCFTHSFETIIWAAKSDSSKYIFNYDDMKKENSGKQMKNIWRIGRPKKAEKVAGKHPTQKPIELLDRIVKASTYEGQIVFDPFSGSGTTGISAYGLNRKFIGAEIGEDYFIMSKNRFIKTYEEK